MAYAAGVYLRQLLEEELIQFLCRALEFEESKVRDFHVRVHNVLEKLISVQCISPSHLAEIQNYFGLLAPTIVDVDLIDEAALFDRVLLDDRNVLDRIPQLMYQLDDFRSRLENFRDSLVSGGVAARSSANPAQENLWEFADSLLSLNKEYRDVISLLNQVAEDAISLLNSLGNLLLKVNHSNDYLGANSIQVILRDAGDQIDDLIIGYPFSLETIDIVALEQVKQIMGDLRDTTDKFESHTSKDPHQCDELQSKPESSSRSKLQQHQGLLHRWKHFFCIRTEGEEDPREVSDMRSPRSSFSQIQNSFEPSPKWEEIVIGLDDDIATIVDVLTRPSSRLSIVTIAGMGGTGKSTLARKVFHHPSIAYHFHFMAWVSGISSPDQLLSHLLHSIARSRNEIQGQSSDEDSKNFLDEIHDKSNEDKGLNLWRSLRKKKYLVVVDDLWNFDAWNAVERYFPDDNLGSRILVTSRYSEFRTDIPKSNLHHMELLDEIHSWGMLEKLVFGVESCPGEFVGLGRLIAAKCGGLRLAIVVIAGILLSIPRSYISWSSFKDSIDTTTSDDLEECLNILALSYNYLPHNLRACFLLLGSFPANCEIDVQKLINLWMAEGFLETKSSNSPQEVAEAYLEDLVRRSLVMVGQMSFDRKIKTCHIHDLLRQLCMREAYKENFMQVFPRNATDQGLEEGRHLIFNSMNEMDLHFLSPLLHPRSLILHASGLHRSQDKLISKLSHYKCLRVLDIYFLALDAFPSAILDLVNLRYLAFSITYLLDASISLLWKLQTLVVYGPWMPQVGRQLECSPSLFFDYWRMPWLRNVIVRVPSLLRCCVLPQRLRDGYPFPSNLQTLSTITFSSCREGFSLMPKLKKLGVYETKEDYEIGEHKRFFQNLPSLTELEILKCSFYKSSETMRSLALDLLPASLKKLTFSGSSLSWDKMELLALLPKLETMKLKDYAFRGELWKLTEVVFGHLKYLLIDKTDLAEWEAVGADHFPCLNRLVLRSCKYLNEIPFDAFTVLEQVDVHNCSQSAENSAKDFQELYGSLEFTATDRTRVVEKGGQSYEYEY